MQEDVDRLHVKYVNTILHMELEHPWILESKGRYWNHSPTKSEGQLQ